MRLGVEYLTVFHDTGSRLGYGAQSTVTQDRRRAAVIPTQPCDVTAAFSTTHSASCDAASAVYLILNTGKTVAASGVRVKRRYKPPSRKSTKDKIQRGNCIEGLNQ